MRCKSIIKLIGFLAVFIVMLTILSLNIIPDKLFDNDYSTVVLDRNGVLLGAKLANDQQWRFQPSDSVPIRFKTAIVAFEDKFFYSHPGINIFSIVFAFFDNIKAKRIIRGGSTISMQVLRLSRKGKRRTIGQKLIETFLTIGLETIYSKDEILNLYCSNAPFGGNVVGLNAASWRYFGHPDHELSWAEAATLAVLPNSPSIIHLSKNRDRLKEKRNRLLLKLLQMNSIDSIQYNLSLLEKIPTQVKQLPTVAPHLIEYFSLRNHGEIINTTIDFELQMQVKQITDNYSRSLLQNEIYNAAVLVVNPENKEVLAYIGNLCSRTTVKINGQYNDMVRANRSSGSILKPFLYAAMIDNGLLLPNSLIRDIPSYFNDYHPENYTNEFQGVIPASKALSQSLNVPAVYMLQEYGIPKFLRLLQNLGFSSFKNSASYYGLSLILGGGEVSLFELVNAYAGMASTLISYDKNYGKYPLNAYSRLKLKQIPKKWKKETHLGTNIPLNAASIWLTYEALKRVSRPETEAGWENYSSSTNIAWKTGTSHGFKDAWSVGSTANYIVGVWVGNANGEGRSGITGTKVAAPIMFDIFSILKNNDRFYPPYDELVKVDVCVKSGYLASQYCPETESIWVALRGVNSKVCTYHKTIFTDKNMTFRLSQKCASISSLNPVSWFVLPPVQEYYYKKKHPSYKTLPPYAYGCGSDCNSDEIDFIYPLNNSTIYVVTDESQQKKEIVFEVSHHISKITIFWHLDNKLIGITNNVHQLPYIPNSGTHILTVVDENGESSSVKFSAF